MFSFCYQKIGYRIGLTVVIFIGMNVILDLLFGLLYLSTGWSPTPVGYSLVRCFFQCICIAFTLWIACKWIYPRLGSRFTKEGSYQDTQTEARIRLEGKDIHIIKEQIVALYCTEKKIWNERTVVLTCRYGAKTKKKLVLRCGAPADNETQGDGIWKVYESLKTR